MIRSATRLTLQRIARGRPAILGYHGITNRREPGDVHRLQVTADRFRLHLELMLEAGFRFVTLTTLLDRLGPEGATASGASGLAVVTFDDGLRNNLTVAEPILSALGISATVYVVSDLIAGSSPWLPPGNDAKMLDASDLRKLVARGWDIGVHTATHADLSQLPYDDCVEEISRCVTTLEQQTGVHPTTLAYPFGRYDEAAMAAGRDTGMRAALTIGGTGWSPWTLTRAMISAGDPLWVFALKLADAYQPLLSSRPVRFVRAWSRQRRVQPRSA